MARPLCIEFEGAWCYVMNRGAARQSIFRDDTQRSYFLQLLADTTERFNAEWPGYGLMGNHYHLRVRTPEGNLQRIMRQVDGLLTQHVNRTRGRDGSLFRGRYQAIWVDAEAHGLARSRYIHRNPLAAGRVHALRSYRGSSDRAYAGYEAPPPWLTTDCALKAIGQRARHRRYRVYVGGDNDHTLVAFYRQARISPILGAERFRARMLAGRTGDIDRPELRTVLIRPAVAAIVTAVSRGFAVDEGDIWHARRRRAVYSPALGVAMYLCPYLAALWLAEIARAFGLANYARADTAMRALKERLAQDRSLAKRVESIKLDLTP